MARDHQGSISHLPVETRLGHLSGESVYYTPEVAGIVDGILGGVDIAQAHLDMVRDSIAETLTNTAVNNSDTKQFLLQSEVPSTVADAIDHLRQDTATVQDKLRILASAMCPEVGSLELARCHHFLGNNKDEEGRMAWLVGEGMGQYGIETLSTELHKIHIHDCHIDPGTGLVTAAVVSLKETISSTGTGIGVRHRLKSYINVAQLGDLMEPRSGYGGSIEDQKTQLQRLLRRPLGSVDQKRLDPVVPTGSPSAFSISRYIGKHPEHLLTSIYYGFRERSTQEVSSSSSTPMGRAAVESANNLR